MYLPLAVVGARRFGDRKATDDVIDGLISREEDERATKTAQVLKRIIAKVDPADMIAFHFRTRRGEETRTTEFDGTR